MDEIITAPVRIGAPYLGILLPALIFGISLLLTFALIRYFIRQKHSKN